MLKTGKFRTFRHFWCQFEAFFRHTADLKYAKNLKLVKNLKVWEVSVVLRYVFITGTFSINFFVFDNI